MPRNPARRPIDNAILETLLAAGDGAMDEEARLDGAEMLRSHGRESSRELDRTLLARIAALTKGVNEAKAALAQQHAMMHKLLSPPWYPAVFLGPAETSQGERALVLYGSGRRVVGLRDGLNARELKRGEEVYLSENAAAIVARAGVGAQGGEIASFVRRLPDGRMILRTRDEEVIVEALLDLGQAELNAGDLVRFERQYNLAFEAIARPDRHAWLQNEAPPVTRAEIGGLDDCVAELVGALTITLVDPERAKLFRLEGRKTVLMHGMPGCGKTLMARYAVSEVERLSGKQCKFVVVSPAQWESKWVGETEKNIRDLFKGLREAAARDGFVVVFLDELDAVGRTRGQALGTHSDRFLAVLLAEIDGFTALGNVAFISATNRLDTIDPALAERLGATQVHVPRPNQRGARAILGVHLPESLPFFPNGTEAAATRTQLIEAGVSRLFAPNADNAVCLVRFRDGKDRTVAARELLSGRLIMQLCETACRHAFDRVQRNGELGLCLADIDVAATRTIERLRASLSVHNIHSHLADLPQDVAVVAVEPLGGRVKQPHRYFHS